MATRILLLYGYHRGTTGSLVERALRQRWPVFAAGPGHEESDHSTPCSPFEAIPALLQRLRHRFQPDLLWLLESGKPCFPTGLAETPLPCWYSAFDPHVHITWQREYAKLFDRVWVSFRQYLPVFQETAHPAMTWMPHGFDPDFYQDHGLERDLDVAFVGHMDPAVRPGRVALLHALQQSGLRCHWTAGIWNEEVAALYSRSRLVFNDNDHGVLNPRNFEAAACGAVVLANPAENLTDFFTPGENILVYHSTEEMLTLARQILADPVRWQVMSQAAKQVAAANTWARRLATLPDELVIPGQARTNPFSHVERVKAHAFVYQQQQIPSMSAQLLLPLVQACPDDLEIPVALTMAHLARGMPNDAAAMLVALLQRQPPDLALLNQLTHVLVQVFRLTRHRQGAQLALQLPMDWSISQRQFLRRLAAS